jgi:hypothetical protein
MNVIRRAVNDQRRAAHLANNSSEIGEKIAADFGGDQRLSPFGAEDQANDEIARSVSQLSFAPSELARFFVLPFPTAGAVAYIPTPLRGWQTILLDERGLGR